MIKVPQKDIRPKKEFIHDKSKWSAMFAHDPGIFKDGDTYYSFSTHNCQIRKSSDLINWEYVGNAFEKPPENAVELTGVETLWAPDIIKAGREYWIYYSASTFGKNRSIIGLAKSTNIEGPYQDHGVVVESHQDGDFNAIDANIINDINGGMWMVYGSFWNGIHIIKLGRETGKPTEPAPGKLLAGRNRSVDRAIEGPYIVYNEKFKKYYLFVSYDSLAKDYNVRAGRSDNIDGPYVDCNGIEMTNLEIKPDLAGNKLIGGYKFMNDDGWYAPGHNSVLNDNGQYYMVHHARHGADINIPYLHIRKIFWTNEGWPVAAPERYAGETDREIKKDEISGEWELIEHDKENNIMITSTYVKLNDDGTAVKEGKNIGNWEMENKNYVAVTIGNKKYSGFISECWDWENWKEAIMVSLLSKDGVSLWGKK